MFSYVFMKILEMKPKTYDRRMDRASGGRVRAVREAVATEIPRESHVLDIGCGPGEFARLLIRRGCTVDGFDENPAMVTAAEEAITTENLHGRFTVRHMGVDGMEALPGSSYDAVTSLLVFSELHDDERRFALRQAHRILKHGGIMVIADEVAPRTLIRRIVHTMARFPLLVMTYLIARKATRPLTNLTGDMTREGFFVEKEVRSHGDSFAMAVGRKREEGDS